MSRFFGGPPFRDRREAGKRLSRKLSGYRGQSPVVFALPRGGVPVAFEVAAALDAPLDVVIARKLGAPGQPELGIGAVAQGGKRVLNAEIVDRLSISEEYIELATRRGMGEIKAAERRFMVGERRTSLRGKTAILVDDGLATGVTARAAILAAKGMGPEKTILAAPVCARQTSGALRRGVDGLVCLESPEDLGAIGFWYRDFAQVSDEEVVRLLEASRR
ncbi:MAG: phosphoribosyltransferase [Rubrobacter sp.]|nr:phosphoribosyltransferase [Rubrobacter sp.]